MTDFPKEWDADMSAGGVLFINDTSELGVILMAVEVTEMQLTPPAALAYIHLHGIAATKQGLEAVALRRFSLTTGMSINTVRKALAELYEKRMVKAARACGSLTRYYLTPKSFWLDPDTGAEFQKIAVGAPVPTVSKSDTVGGTVSNSDTLGSIYSVDNNMDGIEGVQGKKGKGVKNETAPDLFVMPAPDKPAKSHAELILDAYPITPHGRRPDVTLKEIKKVLKLVPFDVLLKKVQMFADSRKGQEAKFTPSPLKFFKEGRHHDHDHNSTKEKPAWGW